MMQRPRSPHASRRGWRPREALTWKNSPGMEPQWERIDARRCGRSITPDQGKKAADAPSDSLVTRHPAISCQMPECREKDGAAADAVEISNHRTTRAVLPLCAITSRASCFCIRGRARGQRGSVLYSLAPEQYRREQRLTLGYVGARPAQHEQDEGTKKPVLGWRSAKQNDQKRQPLLVPRTGK